LARLYTLKADGASDPEWKLSKELWSDWIFMNLPPFNEINIKKKIEEQFKQVEKLRRTHSSQRGATWMKEMKALIIDLDNGFDIRSSHQETIYLLSEEYEIEVGDDEELLYQDNYVPGEDRKCARIRACAGDDKVWMKEAIERRLKIEEKDDKAKKKSAKIARDKAALKKLK
jgi:hypothetical protein